MSFFTGWWQMKALVICVVMLVIIGTVTRWVVSIPEMDKARAESQALPTKFYTNEHRQSIVDLKSSQVTSWLEAHKANKIVSVARDRYGNSTIVYEEIE